MKTFEEYNKKTEPQLGDYVVCDELHGDINNFLLNNVGQIIAIEFFNNIFWYMIKYTFNDKSKKIYFASYYELENDYITVPTKFIPSNKSERQYRNMRLQEIIFFSNNIEDCETFIATKNFNL